MVVTHSLFIYCIKISFVLLAIVILAGCSVKPPGPLMDAYWAGYKQGFKDAMNYRYKHGNYGGYINEEH